MDANKCRETAAYDKANIGMGDVLPQQFTFARLMLSGLESQWEIAAVLHEIKDILPKQPLTDKDINEAMDSAAVHLRGGASVEGTLAIVGQMLKKKAGLIKP